MNTTNIGTKTLSNGFNRAIVVVSDDSQVCYRSSTNTWHDDSHIEVTIPETMRAFTYNTSLHCLSDFKTMPITRLDWKEFCDYTGLDPDCRLIEDNN
jgi:hypothetical protein